MGTRRQVLKFQPALVLRQVDEGLRAAADFCAVAWECRLQVVNNAGDAALPVATLEYFTG